MALGLPVPFVQCPVYAIGDGIVQRGKHREAPIVPEKGLQLVYEVLDKHGVIAHTETLLGTKLLTKMKEHAGDGVFPGLIIQFLKPIFYSSVPISTDSR